MVDKARASFVFFTSLTLALSVALVFLSTQNRELTRANRTLSSSLDSLQARAEKLKQKNRDLFKVVTRNYALVKNAKDQKRSLQDTIDALRKEDEAIQFEIKKAQAQMNSALEEKTYLEDMLIHKTRQIDSLKNQGPAVANAAALNNASATSSEISTRIRAKEEEIARLTEQNRALSEKMDRLYQVTTSKISEINVAKIALEETVSGAKDKINEEWNTVNLGSINVDQNADPAAAKATPSGPKSSGKVLAINENHGFVVVDLGRTDHLSTGANLEIVRDGKNIASLSVLEIRDAMTACNIKFLENGEKIRINDAVLIQK